MTDVSVPLIICYTGTIIMKIVIVIGHVSIDPPLVIINVNKLLTVRNAYYIIPTILIIFFIYTSILETLAQYNIFSIKCLTIIIIW